MKDIFPYLCQIGLSVLAAWIEHLRRKRVYGKVVNINKWPSRFIGSVFFLSILLLFNMWHWQVLFFAVSCAGIRAFVYDPALNLFSGLKFNHQSHTTNSVTDRLENKHKLKFWGQWFMWVGVAIVFAALYELSTKY